MRAGSGPLSRAMAANGMPDCYGKAPCEVPVNYRQMWILQSSAPDGNAFHFRLPAGAVKTVGRAPRADFIVDAALVSRIHCRLTAREERVEVEDLSSTNGTYVNDRRVERAQLATGDRLRVGRVEFMVGRQV